MSSRWAAFQEGIILNIYNQGFNPPLRAIMATSAIHNPSANNAINPFLQLHRPRHSHRKKVSFSPVIIYQMTMESLIHLFDVLIEHYFNRDEQVLFFSQVCGLFLKGGCYTFLILWSEISSSIVPIVLDYHSAYSRILNEIQTNDYLQPSQPVCIIFKLHIYLVKIQL